MKMKQITQSRHITLKQDSFRKLKKYVKVIKMHKFRTLKLHRMLFDKLM